MGLLLSQLTGQTNFVAEVLEHLEHFCCLVTVLSADMQPCASACLRCLCLENILRIGGSGEFYLPWTLVTQSGISPHHMAASHGHSCLISSVAGLIRSGTTYAV